MLRTFRDRCPQRPERNRFVRPDSELAHRNHILDLSFAPAAVSVQLGRAAVEIAHDLAQRLDLVGLICVEFFVTDDDRLLVNEIAPRPHNSGHLTIEACVCSQFEQQVRCLCNLPLGPSELLQPAAMVNLLGDLWNRGEPDWMRVLEMPAVQLYLMASTRLYLAARWAM